MKKTDIFGGCKAGEIKVTCAIFGEHMLLANARSGERRDWTWSCACTRCAANIAEVIIGNHCKGCSEIDVLVAASVISKVICSLAKKGEGKSS